MKSGATSVEIPFAPGVFESVKALPGLVELGLVLNPKIPAGALIALNVVSGFSTATAPHKLSLNFLVTRADHCRAQLYPTTYCRSMVIGTHSFRNAIPLSFVVKRLQVCPAAIEKPRLDSTCAHS